MKQLYNNNRTKYRIKQNGLGAEWLEYKQFLFWYPVPTPYCDNIYYRECCNEYRGWLSNSFDWFVKTYPDIRVYLKNEYYPEQIKLEKQADKWNEEYYQKSRKVKYLIK